MCDCRNPPAHDRAVWGGGPTGYGQGCWVGGSQLWWSRGVVGCVRVGFGMWGCVRAHTQLDDSDVDMETLLVSLSLRS